MSRGNICLSRRELLETTGAAGLATVAGCLGGNGGGETVHITVPPSGTLNQQAGQALQRTMRNKSDKVNINVSEVSGNPDSVVQYSDGESDGYVTDNYAIVAAMAGDDPFQEQYSTEDIAAQAFANLSLHYYWMAIDGSGLETFDDLLEQDVDVWALDPAWGARRFQETVHQNAGVWSNIGGKAVDVEASDVPGAIEENRIDAFLNYGAGYEGLADWATEVDAREDVYVLESTDTILQGVEKTQGTGVEEIEPYGWEQDVGTDSVKSWTLFSQLCLGTDIPDDVAYEIACVSHEHTDDIRNALPSFTDHSNTKDMIRGLMNDVPVHPGVADFYEDQGVWDDSFERAG